MTLGPAESRPRFREPLLPIDAPTASIQALLEIFDGAGYAVS